MKNHSQYNDDHKQIGIFVLPEFALLEPEDFVSSACHPDTKFANLSQMSLKLRDSPDSTQKDWDFSTCIYHWLTPRPHQLTLFNRPLTTEWPFLLNDLQFPYQAVGCVLMINLFIAFGLKVSILSQKHSPPVERRLGYAELEELDFDEFLRLSSIEGEHEKAWQQRCVQSPELLSDAWVTAKFKEKNRNQSKIWQMGGIGWIRKNQLPFVVVAVEYQRSPNLALEEVLDVLEIDPTIPVVRCSIDEKISMGRDTFAPEDIERVLVALVDQIEGGDS